MTNEFTRDELKIFSSLVLVSLAALIIFFGVGFSVIMPLDTSTIDSTQVQTSPINTDVEPVTQSSSEKSVLDNSLNGVMTVYIESEGRFVSQGSAFLISEGYAITNNHVVDSEGSVYFQYRHGDWSQATVVGSDKYTDLAVVKPDTVPSYAQSFEIAESNPSVGTQVYALGSPAGRSGSVTSGIISARDRSLQLNSPYAIPDVIQTDAELTKGSSGGPLINSQGVVVGVNSAKEGSNIGFAISPELTHTISQSLIETGDHTHSLLGVVTTELNPLSEQYNEYVTQGVVVQDTTTETASSELQEKDIIIAIDGESVNTNEDVSSYLLRETSPDESVTLTIVRDNSQKTVEIPLQERD